MCEYETFFQHHYPHVFAVCKRRLSCAHDAEEACMDAFRIIWEKHRDDGIYDVSTLFAILRNVIGNRYRSRNRTEAIIYRIARTRSMSSGLDDSRADLSTAMGDLPLESRRLLWLRYWGGFSCAEISVILRITPQAVRARLTRARRSLRKTLHVYSD